MQDFQNPNEQNFILLVVTVVVTILPNYDQRCHNYFSLLCILLQKLDFENPNEQNFILLVVATEEQTEARLSSSATLRVQVEFTINVVVLIFPIAITVALL